MPYLCGFSAIMALNAPLSGRKEDRPEAGGRAGLYKSGL